MINEIKDKLSKDATTILEALSNEYKDDLIQKAYRGLLMSGKATDTITAKDILKYHDLRTDDFRSKSSLKEIRKKRWYYMIAFIGISYSFVGVVMFFVLDRKISIINSSFVENVSFIAILIGIFITVFSVFFERYSSLRKQERDLSSLFQSMEDNQWEIVKKWTRIENTASEIIGSDIKNTSSMLNWLTSKSPLRNDLKYSLKKLLTTRNQIVHGKQIVMGNSELSQLKECADEILDELIKIKLEKKS